MISEYSIKKEFNGKVRLMFEDEAGFGRINKPKYCWAPKGVRPVVPCHHIREYRWAYGAVDPMNGDSFFRVISHCDTVCMNAYLNEMSIEFKDDFICLAVDGAGWHRSKNLKVPDNIMILRLPAYTPEMNPIEQIWEEIREKGFPNEAFKTLKKVIDRLCKTICSLTLEKIKSITCRSWIREIFEWK